MTRRSSSREGGRIEPSPGVSIRAPRYSTGARAPSPHRQGSPMTLTAKPPAAPPAGGDDAPAAASAARPATRTPRTWVRGGGLSTLVFLAPMLFVFIVFSWSPIVQSVIMSLQETNLLDAADWVGLDNFVHVLERSAARHGDREHPLLRAARAALRVPAADLRGGAHERGATRQGVLLRARLPARRGPAGRGGAAVEGLLRRRARRACSTRSSAGSASRRSRGCSRRRPRCRRSCSRRRGRPPAARSSSTSPRC